MGLLSVDRMEVGFSARDLKEYLSICSLKQAKTLWDEFFLFLFFSFFFFSLEVPADINCLYLSSHAGDRLGGPYQVRCMCGFCFGLDSFVYIL